MTEIIVSARLIDGSLEVVKRYPSNMTYACLPPRPVPDRVVKEVYRSSGDGVVQLFETIVGTHEPARRIKESITFPPEGTV